MMEGPNTMTEEGRRAGDGLEPLRAFRGLEIGPVVVEKRRMRTRYRFHGGGEPQAIDLIYRFEEDVFDPDDPASRNMASMLGVQVGINYGLFCDEILFDGWFDQRDQAFITEMARNTAREIYVKKFLEPNPFLVGKARGLAPFKKDNYLRARLVFPADEPRLVGTPEIGTHHGAQGRSDPDRYAVLSSGGKDSLLTTGLLNELGCEVHPVFVNESGRHWFTALNAYRHLSSTIPATARVWTNSDRVFSWMLRHLPFVRKDFSRLRSDEYPIRLWTVAVFLFGTIPVLRKRAIGRLLIGDEFDTTRRLSHKGIPNYDGLYDQSLYFDHGLTRYFVAKGWGIHQFSILRPLSELLVQKTLWERYPELQRHQVSCHAAHEEGERVKPCGRCEKCRRIVGMLAAIGGDPAHCGYSQAQVEQCLKALAVGGIHQETQDAEHLAFILQEKGLIETAAVGKAKARKRPEVAKLRFDPERSPMEEIPLSIRRTLLDIYLQHSEGAARRSGRVWIDFDPITDPIINRPNPFEAVRMGHAKGPPRVDAEPSSTFILGEMTWPQAAKRLQEVDTVLLPVGSIEQHGPHLPLDTDAFDAAYLSKKVAERCSDPKPLVLPLIPYGVSYHHEDFRGTLSVTPGTLSRLVDEIGMSAARQGITKLVIINGHGGNGPALHFAAQMINRDAHIFTCVDTGETSDPDISALAVTPNDVHAGEIETSTTLAVRSHLVRLREARKFVPRFSNRYLNFSSKRSVGWYAHISKISAYGVLGDPTKADPEKGRKMWEVMIKHLVEFVEDLKGLSLDEIYQKRY
jgi:creatinine amidohydrolase/Fe(II)-dependent formamide hydrolase-like protein